MGLFERFLMYMEGCVNGCVGRLEDRHRRFAWQ